MLEAFHQTGVIHFQKVSKMSSLRTPVYHIVECPICKECTGTPKRLPCLHTVCEGCVNSLTKIRPNTIACPICDSEIDLPGAWGGAEGLPTNLTLVQLTNIIDNITDQGQQKSCEFCGLGNQSITHHCQECEESFCENCASIHSKSDLFLGHKPVPSNIITCQEHHKSYTFFCTDCNRLLCLICIHRGICSSHVIKNVNNLKMQKYTDMRNLIEKMSENINVYKESFQPAKLTLTHLITSIQNEEVKIKQHADILKAKIESKAKDLLAETQKSLKTLQQLQRQIEADDHLAALCNLKKTAEGACDGGIEQTLLALPTILAALPPDPKPVTQHSYTKLIFTPDDSINVGKVKRENERRVSVTMAASRLKLTSTNLNTDEEWEKSGLGDNMWDVTFTQEGHLAYTDFSKKRVVLMQVDGTVLIDTVQQRVKLLQPRGIAYHHKEDALLVCDQDGQCVVFLEPTTLQMRKQVEMLSITTPHGIDILSDGNIVITGRYGPVGVFHTDGSQLYRWHNYNNGANKFGCPFYVAVDRDDNILVSDLSLKKIVKFDKTGIFKCEWPMEGGPSGIVMAGDILLVVHGGRDRVMAHNLHGEETTRVLTWDRGQRDQFGWIKSLCVHGDQLVVIGHSGIRMYTLAERFLIVTQGDSSTMLQS